MGPLSVPFNNLSFHCQIKAPNYIEGCIDQITLVCVPPSVNTILNYLVTLSILIMPWFAFAQINPPAHNGTYDPEFRSLYDHLEKTLISPKASVGDDINGIVYVRFLLNDKGFIIANSITIEEGLSPAADLAVIRALKLFTKPLPFGRTDEHGERSCFIPVKFQFKESLGAQVPARFLSAPLKTVILNKEVKATNPNWRVYAQTGLNGVLGEVAPGDSVTVTGWAAHAFFIQTGRLSGYISWTAIPHDGNMEYLANVVKDRSEQEEAIEEEARLKTERKGLEVMHNYALSTAHLSLKSDKQKLFAGECATITLEFNVSNDNKVPIQFYELENQIRPFLDTLFSKANVFNVSAHIEDIEGKPEVIDGIEWFSYNIYKGSVCPLEAVPLKLNPAQITMMIVKRKPSEKNKLAEFRSKPVIIQVRPAPFTAPKSFLPIGNLKVEESLTAANGLVAGQPFLYHFSISGNGVLLPIAPPRPKTDGIEISLESVEDSDTLRDNTLHSRKTFTYKVLARSPGTYSMQNIISAPYFDPATGKMAKLVSQKVFSVVASSGESRPSKDVGAHFYSVNHCILFDASASMGVEDYKPNRLEAVKLGIMEFLSKGTSCNIGIFAFSRYLTTVSLPDNSNCYDDESIFEQPFLPISGTSIGNAICLAVHAFKPEAVGKKIVVIGDGDITAGPVGVQFAINYASRNNIKVYTIGVGTKGPVPYGVDVNGKANLIDDTFDDKDLKHIAKSTGGKYFHAKDARAIASILSEIFK